jgi:uncharacterized membrane protein YkoI
LKISIIGLSLLLLTAEAAVASGMPPDQKPKITMAEATRRALAVEPGTIKSRELEREKGRLIYSFDIATNKGLHEVNVDAITGKIVEDTVESPAAKAKEK